MKPSEYSYKYSRVMPIANGVIRLNGKRGKPLAVA